MVIEITAGYLLVSFSDEDFRFRGGEIPGGAASVISGIKTAVAREARSYDPELKQWAVQDTPANRKVIEDLKRLYLSDPRQLNLL